MVLIVCLIFGSIMTGLAGIGVRRIGRINERLDKLDNDVTEVFSSPSPDMPSIFSQVVNQVADIIGEKQALVTQASIRGALGGQQRALNRDLEEIAVQEDPGLALTQILPKSLKRNPLALMGLQSILSRRSPGSSPGSNTNNGGQVRFKL